MNQKTLMLLALLAGAYYLYTKSSAANPPGTILPPSGGILNPATDPCNINSLYFDANVCASTGRVPYLFN